jgi:hypothetical protein
MVKVPISAALQDSYRTTLQIPAAPDSIDTNIAIVPVAVIAQTNTTNTASFIKLTDGTDTLAVNTDGSLPVDIPVQSSRQTLFFVNATVGTGADQTAATVSAGKTGWVMWATCTGTGTFNLKSNAGTSLIQIISGAATGNFIGGNVPIAKYAAGDLIKVNMAATGTWSLCYMEV